MVESRDSLRSFGVAVENCGGSCSLDEHRRQLQTRPPVWSEFKPSARESVGEDGESTSKTNILDSKRGLVLSPPSCCSYCTDYSSTYCTPWRNSLGHFKGPPLTAARRECIRRYRPRFRIPNTCTTRRGAAEADMVEKQNCHACIFM